MNQTKQTLWQVVVMQRDRDSFCRLLRHSARHFPWREFKAGDDRFAFFFCRTTPLMPASYKLWLFMQNHNYFHVLKNTSSGGKIETDPLFHYLFCSKKWQVLCRRMWRDTEFSLPARPLDKQHREALVIYSLWRQASACNWFILILVHSLHASHTEARAWHKRILKLPLYSPSRYDIVMPWICCWRFYSVFSENILPALLSEMCCANNQSGDSFRSSSTQRGNGIIDMDTLVCLESVFLTTQTSHFVPICTIPLVWKDAQGWDRG